MLETNILGNNSVGRMYRPDKILNSEKRGFIFGTKYKSNYGGIKSLNIEVNLEFNIKDNTESVKVEITTEDKTKTGVRAENFNIISKKRAKTNQEEVKVSEVRKLVKPDSYNLNKKNVPARIKNDKGVLYMDIFIDSENKTEQEVIEMVIYPSVMNMEEYIVVEVASKTPVVVANEQGVSLL